VNEANNNYCPEGKLFFYTLTESVITGFTFVAIGVVN
tara:strand:- start:327 stop:437 length:111 start_codon:yes stop_codon:yes gene_type:complete